MRIAQGVDGSLPLVRVPAIGVIDNADAVGQDDPEVFESAAARGDMRFIALRQDVSFIMTCFFLSCYAHKKVMINVLS